MTKIDPQQEKDIAATFNKLVKNSGDRDDDISKTLLLIYTPVTSGLVFLSTNLELQNNNEKAAYLTLVSTSVLIVMSIVIQKFGSYLIADTIGKTFANHVTKTGQHTQGPLYGKEWQSRLVLSQTYIKFVLFILNLLATGVFVFLLIL